MTTQKGILREKMAGVFAGKDVDDRLEDLDQVIGFKEVIPLGLVGAAAGVRVVKHFACNATLRNAYITSYAGEATGANTPGFQLLKGQPATAASALTAAGDIDLPTDALTARTPLAFTLTATSIVAGDYVYVSIEANGTPANVEVSLILDWVFAE